MPCRNPVMSVETAVDLGVLFSEKMSAEDFKESASDTGSRGHFVPV